jgi:hypothetical protein
VDTHGYARIRTDTHGYAQDTRRIRAGYAPRRYRTQHSHTDTNRYTSRVSRYCIHKNWVQAWGSARFFSFRTHHTNRAHHVSIWPSGEVVFQQRLIPFVFCALPRPGITSLPCLSGIPCSLASFLFADSAAVLYRCPPSALCVPQAARRLAAFLLRALPRNGALRSPYLASLSLSRPRWRLLSPLRVLQVAFSRCPGFSRCPSLSAADVGRFSAAIRVRALPNLRGAPP